MSSCVSCMKRIWTPENNDSGEFCYDDGLCAMKHLHPEVAALMRQLITRVEKLEAEAKEG